MDDRTLSNTIEIDAPIEKVWDVLTEPAFIKQYMYGTDTTTDREVGSSVTFSGEYEGKSYQDKGTVLENIPQKKLQYTYRSSMGWLDDIPENYTRLTYELEEKEGKTSFTLIQDQIPTEKMYEHSGENRKNVMSQIKALAEKKESE